VSRVGLTDQTVGTARNPCTTQSKHGFPLSNDVGVNRAATLVVVFRRRFGGAARQGWGRGGVSVTGSRARRHVEVPA